jgi:hypothetical protein
MKDIPPVLDYRRKPPSQAPPPAPRTWGMSAPLWLLIALFLAVLEVVSILVADNRVIHGGAEVAFIALRTGLALTAFIIALRLALKAG